MIRTYAYKDIKIEEIFAREEEKTNVADVVAQIIAEVRKGGDAALKRYAEQFDGAAPAVFEVSEEERAAAYAQADAAFLEILKEAAAHIRAFHEKQKRTDFVLTEREGVVLGQKIIPLDRVGLYVPGGTASYPSTVLMDCIPAKIAGVKEVCMVTPAKDGKLNPDIIAAAEIAGVDRIFRIGGAQAVAALAYGTESIPRVDKIVGPGNAFVAEAKKQVFGQVSIDMIAGPSEILVIADGNSDAEIIAADLLSQAEHDKMASAVLVTESEALAQAVTAELERQIALLPRAEIARASIDNNGKIILVKDIAEAIAVSNEIAPEHLEGKEPYLRSLQGFNITIPHKMAIIPIVDELDESAKRYNSVNCVANQNGKLIGYNTDCDGFTMSVKEYPMDGKVLLIGCGGVGRMIATEALRHGANLTIGIIPQDKELVEAFIQEAKQTMPEAKVTYAVTADIHDKFDVIINASPVGMFPKVDACPVSDELIDGADYFFDVIYNPTKTLFLRKALAQGKVAKGGAAMLVLQAVRAHEIWNGDSYTDKQIESIICDMEERIDEQNQTK